VILLVTRKIKDRQFHSSVKLVTGLFLFPIFYLILTGIVALLVHSWWLPWVYLLSLPVSGWLAHKYFIGWKKTRALWKYKLARMRTGSPVPALLKLRKEIIDHMLMISKDHMAEEPGR
jgi:hypothetical protein